MKPISPLRALLFFSCLFITIVLNSCRDDANTPFNLEETQELERDSIVRMLKRSKTLIINDDLEGAIVTLDSIIRKFGTYDEVEEAYRLRDSVQTRYVLKKVIRSQDMDSLLAFIDDYDVKRIKEHPRERINDLVNTTEDPQLLQDFLDSNRLPEYRNTAQRRQEELLAQKEKDLYAKAQEVNNAEGWKDFIKLYPDHAQKDKINDIIIKLEVDAIFAGDYEDIPDASRVGEANYVTSNISLKNSTQYTLTVRYSGPENRKIIIAPRSTEKVNLKSGNYRVTASVNSARVTNYAGRESLSGGYESNYYIR